MDLTWQYKNLSYLSKSGSQSYGTASRLSDTDLKGFTVAPQNVREDLFHRFEQSLNNEGLIARFEHLKNPLNPKIETTVYSLDKFIKLLANGNPNVIELLWTDESDILEMSPVGQKLRENRDLFISSRSKHNFGGYSVAQLYKIQRHRKWIVKGIIEKPERKKYGLPEYTLSCYGEVERFIKRELEKWNFSQYSLDDLERNELKEHCWELIFRVSQKTINWDNWPQNYLEAGFEKLVEKLNLNSEISALINQELKYQADLKEYNSWLNWKKNRNPERKIIEDKCGWDTKHGMHLIRLQK